MASDKISWECPHCKKHYDKQQLLDRVNYQTEFYPDEFDNSYRMGVFCLECKQYFDATIEKDIYPQFYEAYKADCDAMGLGFEVSETIKEYDQKYYNGIEDLPQAPIDVQNKIDGRLKPEFKLTELGNAKRLVSNFGQNIRYCFPWKKWLIWNGKFWERDNTGEIMRLAKETVRLISQEADNISDEKKRMLIIKHTEKSETKSKLEAMITLAQSESGIPIKPEGLDKNTWFLNVKNGTIDLRNGKLLPHNRDHHITKITPLVYDSKSACPVWYQFLNSIMNGNENLIQFIKRAVGYSLTGATKEQCLFFMYGTGANGKSTFLETIREMLADYAQQSDFSTFLNKVDSVRNDLARLQGARFVSGVEADAGKQFAEVFIKRITGGDKITARFLYQEFFEFKPTFKIFLAANHKLTVSGTDHAIWRRIMMIPFTITIPENEMDKGLKNKLRDELPGILNWAVQGCLEWQKYGLTPPEEVNIATENYRAEMDVLGDFIDDCCILQPHSTVSKTEFYDIYDKWCIQNHEQPISKKAFGIKLSERGIASKKSGSTRYWSGIGLRG